MCWNMRIRSDDQGNYESFIAHHIHIYTHAASWSRNHSIRQFKRQWDLAKQESTHYFILRIRAILISAFATISYQLNYLFAPVWRSLCSICKETGITLWLVSNDSQPTWHIPRDIGNLVAGVAAALWVLCSLGSWTFSTCLIFYLFQVIVFSGAFTFLVNESHLSYQCYSPSEQEYVQQMLPV